MYGTYVLYVPIVAVPFLHLLAARGIDGRLAKLAGLHEALFEWGLLDSCASMCVRASAQLRKYELFHFKRNANSSPAGQA